MVCSHRTVLRGSPPIASLSKLGYKAKYAKYRPQVFAIRTWKTAVLVYKNEDRWVDKPLNQMSMRRLQKYFKAFQGIFEKKAQKKWIANMSYALENHLSFRLLRKYFRAYSSVVVLLLHIEYSRVSDRSEIRALPAPETARPALPAPESLAALLPPPATEAAPPAAEAAPAQCRASAPGPGT